MRIPLLIANWKMNHSVADALHFAMRWEKEANAAADREVVICPPFTSLYSLSIAFSEMKGLKLGAQNCHFEQNGAFTGEISPLFLKEIQCAYVLLGHSERRHIFLETDEFISQKFKAVLGHQMIPVLCVGETEAERDKDQTFKVIERQLASCLKGDAGESEFVVAYEPVWAIGTGKNATSDQAQEVHAFIRDWLKTHLSRDRAARTRILYGGSVKGENIGGFMGQPDIDGALVGGASLKVDSFAKIVNYP